MNMEKINAEWAGWQKKLDAFERLMRLDKPIGILLLLWPTLWALWLASYGDPNWVIVWIFVLGAVLMRSAGCVINDLADRKFDGRVERTQNRPLVTGEVSVKEALVLIVFLSLAAFGFGIPMAFAALTGMIPREAWLMLLANIFWAIAYDTEYAMVDREDDLKIGIRSSAIFFQRFDVLAIMVCYAAMLTILMMVGIRLGLRWPYYLGLLVAGGIAGYHYFLIRNRDRNACFRAFLHNNWLGAAIFAGIFLSYLLGRMA